MIQRGVKKIMLALCLIGVVFALIPFIGYGILNLGNGLLLGISGYIGIYILTLEQRPQRSKWLSKLIDGGLVGALALTMVFLGLTGLMVDAAYFNEPSGQVEEKTVLVLGCKVEGDRPSLTLQYRLDAAYDYLAENPQSNCVVTGGLGEGKSYTESAVMKAYLVKRGIDQQRIYEERQAKNTFENIEFSLQIIEEKRLSTDLVVVTSDFHQYRAGLNLNQYGLTYEGKSGKMPWGLIPTYWTREYIAILRDILFFA